MRQPVTWANAITGRNDVRQVRQHRVDLLVFEEARPGVPFLEQRNVRHVEQLAVLLREVEHPLQVVSSRLISPLDTARRFSGTSTTRSPSQIVCAFFSRIVSACRFLM